MKLYNAGTGPVIMCKAGIIPCKLFSLAAIGFGRRSRREFFYLVCSRTSLPPG